MTTGSAAGDRQPLSVLESSGLIRLAATRPELEYLFRHVLVQDAAYETLLKQERRRLHLVVGETLEAHYPDRLDELAATLAWHYQEADERERALDWLLRAGRHALRRYANVEAFAFFDRAGGLAPDGDDPAVVRQRIEIALGKVRSGWIFRTPSELIEYVQAVAGEAEALGDQRLIGQVQLAIASMRWQLGDAYLEGTELKQSLDRAIALSRSVGDLESQGMALTILGRSSLMSSDPRRSAEALEEAIALTEGHDFIGTSLAADTLGMVYSKLGRFDEADASIRRAYELAQRSGDPTAMVDADLGASAIEAERGNLEAAVDLARKGAIRADALGAVACSVFANFLTGTAELALGRPDRAVIALQASRALGRQHRIDMWGDATDASISSAQCSMGDIGSAEDGWRQALENVRHNQDIGLEAMILYQRARSRASTPEPDWESILADLQASIAIARELGTKPREAMALRESVTVLGRLGRPDQAALARQRLDALARDMGIAPGS